MRAWEEFVKRQERIIGKETALRWLLPLKVLRFDAANLFLEAKDAFQAGWFEEHIRPLAEKELKNNNGRSVKIHIQLAPANIIAQSNYSDENLKKTADISFGPDALDPYALFPQFVTTDETKVAFQVLSELAGFDPSTAGFKKASLELGTFNPIYLHGPKGSGKTHLLMAVAKTLSRNGHKVFYVKAETFTEHVIHAMRSSQMQLFRQTYRHVDVLIIDDVHLLARKNSTQEELFHTFNSLHTQGKQIIFSANCPPRLLSEIEERLISRFEWGIALGLDRVTTNELRKILIDRSELLRFPLKKEIVAFMLDHFTLPTTLIKALETLILRSHLSYKQSLTFQNAKSYLEDLIDKERQGGLSSTTILKTVAEVFGIKTEDILSKSQCREFVLPRQIAMYLCRETLKMPYMKIASIFARDHSTVMTSVKSIAKSLTNQDRDISSCLTDIQRKVVNL